MSRKRTWKKAMALLAAVMLVVCMIPTGLVLADTANAVVLSAEDAAAGTAELDGMPVVATLNAAFVTLGAAGGTVYVKGTYTASEVLENYNDYATRDKVTVTGYNGDSSNGLILNYAALHSDIKGELEFDNITLAVSNTQYNSFAFNKNHVIYGENVITSRDTAWIGTGRDMYNQNVGKIAVTVKGGNFKDVEIIGTQTFSFHGATYNEKQPAIAKDVTVNIAGGDIGKVGFAYQKSPGFDALVDGPINYNITGGTIDQLNFGGWYSGDQYAVYTKHDAFMQVGGTAAVNDVWYGDFIEHSSGDTVANRGNMAFIVDAENLANGFAIKNLSVGNYSTPAKAEGKKFLAIVNHDDGRVTFADNLGLIVDYMVKAKGGIAQPVFEGEGTASTLIGFALIPDDATVTPKIGGVEPEKVEGKTYTYGGQEYPVYALSAFGANATTEVVMEKQKTPVVTADETFVAGGDELKFATVTEAVDYLGTGGGKIYIKGDLTVDYNFDANTTTRSNITLAGYGDSAEGGKFIMKAQHGAVQLKGHLTFENITLQTGDTTWFGFSYDNVTYGTGVKAGNSGEDILVATQGNTYSVLQNDVNVEILDGTYSAVAVGSKGGIRGVTVNADKKWYQFGQNATFNIKGGTISQLKVGRYDAWSKGAYALTGDIRFNITGGTVSSVQVGSQAVTAAVYTMGDTVFAISGNAAIGSVMFGDNDFRYITEQGAAMPEHGNVALVVDAQNLAGAMIIGSAAEAETYWKAADGKYHIIVVNHAESGKATVSSDLSAYVDYLLKVEGGIAQPVFEGEGAASTLIGFALIPDEVGASASIDGVAITTVNGKTYTHTDGNTYPVYDLSNIAGVGEQTVVFEPLSDYFGYSVNGDRTALRFGFALNVAGVVLKPDSAYEGDISNAVVTVNGKTYPVVTMGGIISNKNGAQLTVEAAAADTTNRILDITATRFLEVTDTEVRYAIGVKNIPKDNQMAYQTPISCRAYLIYQDGDTQVTVYGETITKCVNDYLNAVGQ